MQNFVDEVLINSGTNQAQKKLLWMQFRSTTVALSQLVRLIGSSREWFSPAKIWFTLWKCQAFDLNLRYNWLTSLKVPFSKGCRGPTAHQGLKSSWKNWVWPWLFHCHRPALKSLVRNHVTHVMGLWERMCIGAKQEKMVLFHEVREGTEKSDFSRGKDVMLVC